MNDTHKLILLSTLIRTFFSEELQNDNTPEGVSKKAKLQQAILDMSKYEG